ncbi:hypothetical protein ABZT49_07720 [Methylobacterium sp. EM32]|uniref:hypothetical protein n=1 Tax=Methylobacterium sp. EM32 TaxID=3163481 RepID=UPI0033BC2292
MISWRLASNLIGCFGTDNRDFSKKLEESSRVSAMVLATHRVGEHKFYKNCGITIRRDCRTGRQTNSGRCDPARAVTTGYKKLSNQAHEYSFLIKEKNPLAPPGSPYIDAEIKVKEEWTASAVTFSVSGKVDDFPAYEGYVSFDGETKFLFQINPVIGSTPASLFGSASRPINGSATFDL